MKQLNPVLCCLLLLFFSVLSQTALAQQPDLIAVKTNDTGGVAVVGTPFTWSIQVSNIGTGNYFINGSFSILRDELPNTDMVYGSPVISAQSGITGRFSCSISSDARLNCEDNSAFTMQPGGTFTVSFSATASSAGTFANPRSGGICRADAGNEDEESNESNNDCSDTVVVTTGVTGPDLTVSKNNSAAGVVELAEPGFDWTLAVANGGDSDASFSAGQAILRDELPSSGASYGTPSLSNQLGLSGSGSIACSIAASTLSCVASGGPVTLAATTGAFTVTVPVTATAIGTLANPRSGGSCLADPDNVISEDEEANNSCSDSVTVNGSPDLVAVKSNDTAGLGTVGTPFNWAIAVSNNGSSDFEINGAFNILRDELPTSNMSYGTPAITSISGVSGDINCGITAALLVCSDATPVSIAPGGGFTVTFSATPTAADTFSNPRGAGVCRADFGNEDAELDEGNNDCSDTVVVGTASIGPDLTVAKNNSVAGATELAAGPFNWTLTVTNGGDEDASFSTGQLLLQDDLPSSGAAYGTPVVSGQTDLSGTGALNCGIAANTLSCSASGGTVVLAPTSGSFTVTVPVTPDATGTLSNPRGGGQCQADPGGVITEDNESNNSCSDAVVVEGSPDLVVSKANNTSDVGALGEPFLWSLTVSNTGSGDFFQNGSFSVLRDELPASGLDYGAPVVSAVNGVTGNLLCAIDGSFVLTCADSTPLTIAPGGGFTVTVEATPTSTGIYNNPRSGGLCRVNPGNEDEELDRSNNDCSDTVSVSAADLSLTLDDGVVSARPGEPISYSLVFSNTGPDNEPNATLSTGFAGELECTFTSTASGGATGNTVSGSGDLAESLSMPSGSMITYTASCDIDGATTGTLSSTASASGTLSDPDTSNNSATDSDTVLTPEADLIVTKSDGLTSAIPGQDTIAYEVTVRNAGPSDDTAASLSDSLPDDLTCSYGSTAADGASGNTVSGLGDLAESLALPAGASVTYRFSCDIDPAATGTLSNTATATASVTDPDTANNSATDDDTVLNAEADLAVTITEEQDPVLAGTPARYTVTVTNNGPALASQVIASSTLPAGTTLVSSSGCLEDPSADSLCTLGDLPPGNSVAYVLEVQTQETASGTISFAATAGAVTADGEAGNNSATEDTFITALASDLALTLSSDAPTPIEPGDQFVVVLGLSNAGPQDDVATVELTLSSGLDFMGQVAGPDSNCVISAAQGISIEAGALTAGESRSCRFEVRVRGGGPQQVTASARGENADPVLANSRNVTLTIQSRLVSVPVTTPAGKALMVALLLMLGMAMLRRRGSSQVHKR